MGDSQTIEADLHSPAALAKRHEQVVGAHPRIEPLSPEELTGEARDLCISIREAVGVTEHSNIPEYMRTMVKHPEIFRCQMEMGTVIFQGRIPPRERELAVLRIGWLCRAPYEWGEHVDIGKRYGLSDGEVARVIEGGSAPGWSEHDAAILTAVDELLTDKAIAQPTWDMLAKNWDEAQLIEFPMMVGQYVATAFVQNSLRVRLASDNPGMTNR